MSARPPSDPAALARLRAHFDGMPPVAAMGVAIAGWDGHALSLSAPLAAHRNDKGSAYGGSLVSLMTATAWGLVTLKVEAAGLDADVFVADSQVRYRAPLLADLTAQAQLETEAGWPVFLATLRARGRARATVLAQVALPDGGVATEARMRYAAILRAPVVPS